MELQAKIVTREEISPDFKDDIILISKIVQNLTKLNKELNEKI